MLPRLRQENSEAFPRTIGPSQAGRLRKERVFSATMTTTTTILMAAVAVIIRRFPRRRYLIENFISTAVESSKEDLKNFVKKN